jgi:Fe2+ or Zn2+ uptake regulation protein
MSAIRDDQVFCEECQGVFEKGWSEEEAREEAAENFPGLDIDNCMEAALVCDDCYRRIMGLPPAEVMS